MTHSTTTGTAGGLMGIWLNKKFLSDLEFRLQHQKFTTKAIIPPGQGNIGRFLSWAPPSAPSSYSQEGGATVAGPTAITEGSTTMNEITSITNTSTQITISEYGEFTKITQAWEYAAVPGSREKILKRLRDGAAWSIDRVVLLAARKTASCFTCSAAADGGEYAATWAITLGPAATSMNTAALVNARGNMFTALATGFEGVPGCPSGQYAAVLTPTQETQMVTEVTTSRVYWSNAVVNTDSQVRKFIDGYLGSIYGVACYVTQNYTTCTFTSATEIGTLYADGGVGAVAFKDMQPEIVLNDLNSPYKNVNTAAWHVHFGAGLLASARVMAIYSLS